MNHTCDSSHHTGERHQGDKGTEGLVIARKRSDKSDNGGLQDCLQGCRIWRMVVVRVYLDAIAELAEGHVRVVGEERGEVVR